MGGEPLPSSPCFMAHAVGAELSCDHPRSLHGSRELRDQTSLPVTLKKWSCVVMFKGGGGVGGAGKNPCLLRVLVKYRGDKLMSGICFQMTQGGGGGGGLDLQGLKQSVTNGDNVCQRSRAGTFPGHVRVAPWKPASFT